MAGLPRRGSPCLECAFGSGEAHANENRGERYYGLARTASGESDCDCDEELRTMRGGYGEPWKAVPDYDPYKVSGDFNGDGVDDIAVVVLDTRRHGDAFALVVFNGPYSPQAKVTFMKTGLDLKQGGLFCGPPRPKPYRLVFGRFEADGTLLVPSGKTYRLE
jgi:hypothetical protein